MIARLLAVALLGCTVIAVAGLLTPVYPPADFINHFRPFILAGATALLIAALMLRAPRLIVPGAALTALNAVLIALPLLWSAAPARPSTAGQALASAGEREIKIVTFNMAYGDAGRVARFVEREKADIVVLQEVGARHARALRVLLGRRYPNIADCTAVRRCAAAILARRPWVATGHASWSSDSPETIWALFDDPELGRFRVLGVHLALPFRAKRQTRHVDRLIAVRRRLDEPTIVAGDFNMTPWSYPFQRLIASAGLRLHAAFLRSWPTDRHRLFRLPAPAFLIDHVLTTPDIRSVSIRTGPHLGSDHLPVIARVRLPGR